MTTERPRQLRRNQTNAEQMLWARLRNRQVAGYKFRRQVTLGAFVVDFLCFEAKLVVEVDGGQHAGARQQLHDQQRTKWLEKQGYRGVRFWNTDVLDNTEGVLSSIAEALTDR